MKDEKDTSHAWIEKLESQLQDCIKKGKFDIDIPYKPLSFAFPGDVLEAYIDVIGINKKALKHWAKERGWSVAFDHEKADPKHKDFPPVRFTR